MVSSAQRITSTARFVLVVEKDTVFNKLLLANVIGMFCNRCILLTGKGYPDVNTRLLLSQLWQHLRIPIYIVCDADPHGIQIMLTYRYGSLALPMCAAQLAVPQCRWLGLLPTDCMRLGLATLSLADQDVRLLRRMMARPYVDDKVRGEMQWLLTHRRKAEIEAMDLLEKGYLWKRFLAERLAAYME